MNQKVPFIIIGAALLFLGIVAGMKSMRGTQASDFGYEHHLSGPTVTMGDGFVVLDFWATWCGPCVASIPHMNELVTTFANDNVQFLMVSDEAPGTVQNFMQKRPIKATVVIDSDRSMFRAYNIRGIPHSFVINPEGKVVWEGHPMRLTAQVLNQLIAG